MMTLQEAFDSFLKNLVILKRSEKTIQNYKDFLSPFLRFAGSSLPVSSVTLSLVRRYIYMQSQRDVSVSTYATYIRHLKAFLSWLCGEYNISLDVKKIKLPKEEKKEIYLLTPDDVRMLFSVIKAESPWMTARNRAMVALMYDSGLRRNEVCTLLRENVHFQDMTLVVRGKGRKERVVPLGRFTARFLQEYLDLCPFSDSPYVFVSRRGKPASTDVLKQLIQDIKPFVPFQLSSHKLRHNFATNWCLDSYKSIGRVDIYSLKAIMGHESLKTTERYLHYAQSRIAAHYSHSHLDMIFLDSSKDSA